MKFLNGLIVNTSGISLHVRPSLDRNLISISVEFDSARKFVTVTLNFMIFPASDAIIDGSKLISALFPEMTLARVVYFELSVGVKVTIDHTKVDGLLNRPLDCAAFILKY